jgi:hypothetical protein
VLAVAHEVLQVQRGLKLHMLVDFGAVAAVLEALQVDGKHVGRDLNGDPLLGTHLDSWQQQQHDA